MVEETTPAAHDHSDDHGRRDFLNGTLLAGAAVTAASMTPPAAQAQPGIVPGTRNHYYVPANDKTVHWGYFSKLLKPLVEVNSGDFVTIEALTHHANDDAERMVKDDPGADPLALPSLKAFAEGSRILLGTDFPDAPAGVDASFTVKLDGLTADAHKAISDRNTWTLFPRLIRTVHS